MDIDEADIDHVAAADGDPCLSYPFDLDTPVDQDMKMGIPVLLVFQDANVLRRAPMMTLQVDSQLCKRCIQVANRIALDFRWVEG